eukprot:297082_1
MEKTYSTMFLVVCSLCLLSCIILLILLMINIKKYPHLVENRIVIYFSVGAISLYIICITVQIPAEIYSNRRVVKWTIAFQINFCIEQISWHFAQACTYLLFIYRLYYTFKGTQYQSKMRVYVLLHIAVILFTLEGVFVVLIYELNTYGYLKDFLLNRLHTVELISKSLMDLILTIYMIQLFISKLLNISAELQDNGHADRFEQNILMSISAKICILSIFALITTQIMITSASINCVVYMFEDDTIIEEFFYHQINTTYGNALDSTVNVFCVYLTLPYNDSVWMYGKLCHGCNSLCLLMAKTCFTKQQKHVGNVYYLL